MIFVLNLMAPMLDFRHRWTSEIENYSFCCVVIVSLGSPCLSLMRG